MSPVRNRHNIYRIKDENGSIVLSIPLTFRKRFFWTPSFLLLFEFVKATNIHHVEECLFDSAIGQGASLDHLWKLVSEHSFIVVDVISILAMHTEIFLQLFCMTPCGSEPRAPFALVFEKLFSYSSWWSFWEMKALSWAFRHLGISDISHLTSL